MSISEVGGHSSGATCRCGHTHSFEEVAEAAITALHDRLRALEGSSRPAVVTYPAGNTTTTSANWPVTWTPPVPPEQNESQGV